MKKLFMALACALLAIPCFAQRSTPIELQHPAPLSGDYFGMAVAISGDTIIVGSHLDGVGSNAQQGSAHVYRWNLAAWEYEATLTASDGGAGDNFAYSVALSGDTAIIGARGSGADPNVKQISAYVFTRVGTTWTQQEKLVVLEAPEANTRRVAVAIDGNTAVVGATDYGDAIGSAQSVARVFHRSGSAWTQQAEFIPSEIDAEDKLGCSVAIRGDTAVVGAFFDTINGNYKQGSAYVFTRTGATWTEQAKLVASDGEAGDDFGFSVALDGDTAVVGAYLDTVLGSAQQGSAYVFVRSGTTWSQQAKLTGSDAAAVSQVGYSVAISGDTALVGAQTFSLGDGFSEGSVYVFSRTGSTWTEQVKFRPSKGDGIHLGYSVAISDDMAVAGAPYSASTRGSARVYSRIGDHWLAPDTQILTADGAATDFFGMSASVSGDYAVVGAGSRVVGANNNQGAAFVYIRSGHQWIQQAMLVASDGAVGDNFGQSVSISGNTIIVGADRNDHGGPGNAERGAAYVFTRSGSVWTQQAKLIASDAANDDQFGYSVAIDGNTAIVGSYLNDIGANANQGSAYVYVRNGSVWTQQANLIASASAANDYFGFSVAISGDTALVGAYRANVGANTDQGAAYIFTRSGTSWTQQMKLTASDGAASDNFGWSVSLSGDYALIGAFGAAVSGQNAAGAAYVFFRFGGWSQQQKLVSTSPAANDNFGKSLAISGDTALVGAPLADIAGAVNSGAAYIFTRVGSLWNSNLAITDPTGAPGDTFGTAIGLSGGIAVVSSQNDTVGANATQGSARALDVPYDDFRGVYNQTFSVGYASLASALLFSLPESQIVATETTFRFGGSANTGLGTTMAISCSGDIHAPTARPFSLGASSSLFVPAGRTISIFGTLSSFPDAAATISGDSFLLGSRGTITARAASSITVNSPASSLDGRAIVEEGSSLSFSGSMRNIGPVIGLTGSSLSAGGTITNIDLTSLTDAVVTSPLFFNRDELSTVGSCSIMGSFTNDAGASALINSGTLSVSGTLINDGTITGEICEACSHAASTLPPNLDVQGNLTQSSNAGLVVPYSEATVRVGGNYDCAINANTRYDMAAASLQFDGAGPEQTLEAMSTDIGAISSGLDRTFAGHYPVGTLEIATASTVRLVDIHDNDTLGQGIREAVYVNELRINSGAHLINTADIKIYYNTLINNGAVDVPANLIQIGTPPCAGDLNGDAQVDDSDFVIFAGAYNILDCFDPSMPLGCPADINGDDVVDDADFVLFAAAYNELICP